MTPNTTTAAAEAAKNIEIYNQLADIARTVFNHIEGTPEGKIYTPADIARAIVGGPVVTCVNGLNYRCDRVEPYQLGDGLTWAEGYDPATAYDVENGGFSCRVIAWKIFDVLDRFARSADIAPAARVTFERPRAVAPLVLSFTLSTTAARELAACCAKDELRPVMNGVQLDTRRRVLVATNGFILRVFQLGAALTVDESTAAPSYIIPADVLKSGRVITIDANNIVSTDKMSAPAIPGRFPNWAMVIPAASDAGRVSLTADQWKQLKKAVATAATVHPSGKYSDHHVIIAHEFMSDVLHVYSYNYDFNRERDIIVPVDNCRDQFSIRFEADFFKRIAGTPSALYLRDQSRAIVAVDASGLSLLMPKLQSYDDKYNLPFTFAEGAADLLPGLNIATAAAEIKEENDDAAAAEIVATVREKCEGKSAAKMLKYMNDNYGWSPVLERARALLTAESERETATADEAAAPAADQMTTAEAVSVRENERESTNEAESVAPVLFTADGDTFRRGDRVIMKCLYYSDRAEVVGTLTDKERGGSTAEVTDDTGRKFYGWYAGVKHATAEAIAAPADQMTTNEADTLSTTDESTADETPAPVVVTLPPLAELLTMSDAPAALSLSLPTPRPLLLPVLTTNESTNEADTLPTSTPAPVLAINDRESDESTAAPAADQMTTAEAVSVRENERESTNEAEAITHADEMTTNESTDTPAPWSSPFALLPELPDIDTTTADEMTAAELLTTTTDESTNETPAAVIIAASFAERARRWFHIAAVVLAVLIMTAAPMTTTNEADTLPTSTPAPVLVINDRESDESTAAPAADQMTTAEAVSVRENERESTNEAEAIAPTPRRHHHHRRHVAPVVIIADTLSAPELLTITPDTLSADTLSARALPIDTLEGARNITATADTLTADTLERAQEITAPTADDIDNNESETPAPVLVITTDESNDETADDIDTTDEGESVPTPTPATTGTPSPSTPATTGTPAPVSVSPAVLAWLLTL